MEILLTYVKIAHGRRIYMKNKELRKNISFDDIKNGYDVFIKNKKTKKEPIFMNSIYIQEFVYFVLFFFSIYVDIVYNIL